MSQRTFTAGFLFCGLGAGALGFLEAAAQLEKHGAKFVSVGGIDIDPLACKDFEYLTKSPATVADISKMQPHELREKWGDVAPDCVFLSAPCKGMSGLLSEEQAATEHYQTLNKLGEQGLFLLCETWDSPPALLVFENVPRITSRGAELLDRIRKALRNYGYVFHEAAHDCGEIGGLAQHRRRYLMVARLPKKIPAFIYQPPKQRVKGCGEVLGLLPLPEDPSAGKLHELPNIEWLTWVRLALIPAGGDWRDLPRSGTPLALKKTAKNAKTFSDRPGLFGVLDPNMPAPTVTGQASVSSGNMPAAIADPRISTPLKEGQAKREVFAKYPVRKWTEPTGAITGPGTNGEFGVADPRVELGCQPRSGAYGVLSWQEAAGTITGAASVDNGAFAIADPRKAPEKYPVIIAADNTWHRPLTILEFAALQGLPATVDGAPLSLAGKNSAKWKERIGNAVPVGTAKTIAASLLTALLAASLGTWTLGSTGIWVKKASLKKTRKTKQRSYVARERGVSL